MPAPDETADTPPPPAPAAAPTAGPQRTLAWLVCDPLPPVVLGPKPEVTIGRSTTCDLVLPHASVSRVHAVVRVEGGRFLVEDRSSFGCFVNGEKLAGPRPLLPTDRLTIGPFTISVAPVMVDALVPGLEATQPLVVPADPLGQGTSMAGRFEKVSPIELLQGFEFHRKTAKLTFETAGAEGELVVVDGRLAHARTGDLLDFEAAVRIATLQAGLFSVGEPTEAERASPPKASIMEVLLEAYRRLDEAQRGAAEVPVPDASPAD